MSKTTLSTAAAGPACAMALILAASPVAAQMFERAYSFTARDRASLAVIMKQAESGMFEPQSNQATTSGGGSLDYTVNNLICGGDSGSANAEGNSACIILNGSTGSTVGTGQDAIGNQDAASSVETTQNNGGTGSLSSALESADDTGGNQLETAPEAQ
jgi:hypothetical protein